MRLVACGLLSVGVGKKARWRNAASGYKMFIAAGSDFSGGDVKRRGAKEKHRNANRRPNGRRRAWVMMAREKCMEATFGYDSNNVIISDTFSLDISNPSDNSRFISCNSSTFSSTVCLQINL